MAKIIADSWDELYAERDSDVDALIRSWADGKVRDITRGEDYKSLTPSMRGTLGSWAGRNGYRFKSTTRDIPADTIRFSLTKKGVRDPDAPEGIQYNLGPEHSGVRTCERHPYGCPGM